MHCWWCVEYNTQLYMESRLHCITQWHAEDSNYSGEIPIIVVQEGFDFIHLAYDRKRDKVWPLKVIMMLRADRGFGHLLYFFKFERKILLILFLLQSGKHRRNIWIFYPSNKTAVGLDWSITLLSLDAKIGLLYIPDREIFLLKKMWWFIILYLS